MTDSLVTARDLDPTELGRTLRRKPSEPPAPGTHMVDAEHLREVVRRVACSPMPHRVVLSGLVSTASIVGMAQILDDLFRKGVIAVRRPS